MWKLSACWWRICTIRLRVDYWETYRQWIFGRYEIGSLLVFGMILYFILDLSIDFHRFIGLNYAQHPFYIRQVLFPWKLPCDLHFFEDLNFQPYRLCRFNLKHFSSVILVFKAKACAVFSYHQLVDHVDQLCAGIRSILFNLPTSTHIDYVPEPINAAISSILKTYEESNIEVTVLWLCLQEH